MNFIVLKQVINWTILDASGNPLTESVQSVAVTDASGNPVTGINNLEIC